MVKYSFECIILVIIFPVPFPLLFMVGEALLFASDTTGVHLWWPYFGQIYMAISGGHIFIFPQNVLNIILFQEWKWQQPSPACHKANPRRLPLPPKLLELRDMEGVLGKQT